METLTDRQEQLLAFIRAHMREHGYAPTLREMGDHLGIKWNQATNDHLDALERKGCIRRDKGRSRSITLVSEDGESCPHCGQKIARAS